MSHLTEDQIDELLMGSLEPGEATRLREHAAGCEACAAQLAEIEAPIASFNAVSLAWSERRSATLPVRPAQRVVARWGARFAWGSLAAAAVLAAIIPVMRHEQNLHQQAQNNTSKTQTGSQPSTQAAAVQPAKPAADSSTTEVQENAQEIASDNRLLAMVDEELNAPLPSLKSATHGRGSSNANTSGPVQD